MTFGNVPITPGTGKNIGVDTISGVEFQRMKLVAGTEGVSEAIGADDQGTEQSSWMTPRRKYATQSIASAGLTTASTNYGAGDTVSSGWTFTSMARAAGLGGKIKKINILDKGDVMTGCTLFLATASITFGTDNAAVSVSDTDAQKLTRVPGFGFDDLGGCKLATLEWDDGLKYFCDATSLFIYMRTEIANNFFVAVTDLYITVEYEQD